MIKHTIYGILLWQLQLRPQIFIEYLLLTPSTFEETECLKQKQKQNLSHKLLQTSQKALGLYSND